MTLVVDLLEIAHDLIDLAHNGEGMGAVPDDGGQGRNLGTVDNADENIDLLAQIHTLAGDQRGAVMEPLNDLPGDELRILRDNLKADRASDIFCHLVRDGGSP